MLQAPVQKTPIRRVTNPLVLIACVCDKYVDGKLPVNDEDIANIRAMCKQLNYNDIFELDGDKFGTVNKSFLEFFLRPARQYLNNIKKNDGLLFFYSGHGDYDSICLPNNENYKWKFIFDWFNGNDSNCPSLNDKPKIFVIDSCRGRNLARSVSNSNVC